MKVIKDVRQGYSHLNLEMTIAPKLSHKMPRFRKVTRYPDGVKYSEKTFQRRIGPRQMTREFVMNVLWRD